MKCPSCTTADLVMSERQGIEIDYCPACRGVWLDRGELDKIIERAAAAQGVPAQAAATAPAPQQAAFPQHGVPPQAPYYGHPAKDHHHDDHHGRGNHRKRSFLHDLFD